MNLRQTQSIQESKRKRIQVRQGRLRRFVPAKTLPLSAAALFGLVLCAGGAYAAERRYQRLSMDDYMDKMKAGWIGQMVGVGWGAPTEFKYPSVIMPATAMPVWQASMVNQFNQDDLYVEMTFLRTLELHGLDVSIRQAGLDFACSGYRLWHANQAGRDNLRRGIAPPDSGHPRFNAHADDIDYQIEADFAGLISPGMPNAAIQLGEKFGRLMNYGDGLYGGQFVAGMYAAAFFETDREKIVRAGLACIPPESQYAECIRDVLAAWKRNPTDWQKTWQDVQEKYHDNPDYRRFACGAIEAKYDARFNIDAKINGAYIVMGLLYGEGDPDRTVIISARCGQDSDCNPSNAAGVLFTTLGLARVPERFKSALDPEGRFSHTPYRFPDLVKVCGDLARRAVIRAGGSVERDDSGRETLVIPVEEPRPGPLEQCWNPGPIADARFSEDEMSQIVIEYLVDLKKGLEKFAPGWEVTNCGEDMEPGLRDEYNGRKNVLMTHPLSRAVGCVLSRKVTIPKDRKTRLRLVVGHHPRGDWDLIVRADHRELLRRPIGAATAEGGWVEVDLDLSSYAGREILLELVNQASGWAWEAGYWAQIALIEEE